MNYSRREPSWTYKTLVRVLILILFITLGYLLLKINKQSTKAEIKEKQRIEQVKTNDKIKDWKVIEDTFTNEVHEMNMYACLEGTRSIRRTYSTTDRELNYDGSNSVIGWLVGKLNQLQTRSICVETTYKYVFMYDMSMVDVNIDENGIANIRLSTEGIYLYPISELSGNRTISNENGILSNKFSVKEVSSIMYATQIHTTNQILSDNQLYLQSLHNTEENLKVLADKLGVTTNIKYDDPDYIENLEVEVIGE